jgi:hypothetical protein
MAFNHPRGGGRRLVKSEYAATDVWTCSSRSCLILESILLAYRLSKILKMIAYSEVDINFLLYLREAKAIVLRRRSDAELNHLLHHEKAQGADTLHYMASNFS